VNITARLSFVNSLGLRAVEADKGGLLLLLLLLLLSRALKMSKLESVN